LRRQIGQLEGHAPSRSGGALALGVAALDDALPWGGLPRAALHDITGAPGDGAALGFAVAILARLKIGRPILWCRTQQAIADHGALYGPGLAAGGVSPRQVMFVTVAKPADALWVLEEGLRCQGLAAVVGEGVAPSFTEGRRLQLAARGGSTLGLVLPPSTARPAPSAALTRWHVTSAAALPPRRAWRVALQQCRGGRPTAWHVEWKDAALCGALAVPLADGPMETPAAATG
jgi:protein ImuA